MISKHVGLQARRIEALAQAEAVADHPETALDFYFQATVLYAGAQHVIFRNNDEKRYLYAGVRRCYDQVIALAPYRIEHVDQYQLSLIKEKPLSWSRVIQMVCTLRFLYRITLSTRLIQDYLGHRNIQHTVRYTATNPARFERLWR